LEEEEEVAAAVVRHGGEQKRWASNLLLLLFLHHHRSRPSASAIRPRGGGKTDLSEQGPPWTPPPHHPPATPPHQPTSSSRHTSVDLTRRQRTEQDATRERKGGGERERAEERAGQARRCFQSGQGAVRGQYLKLNLRSVGRGWRAGSSTLPGCSMPFSILLPPRCLTPSALSHRDGPCLLLPHLLLRSESQPAVLGAGPRSKTQSANETHYRRKRVLL